MFSSSNLYEPFQTSVDLASDMCSSFLRYCVVDFLHFTLFLMYQLQQMWSVWVCWGGCMSLGMCVRQQCFVGWQERMAGIFQRSPYQGHARSHQIQRDRKLWLLRLPSSLLVSHSVSSSCFAVSEATLSSSKPEDRI